MQDEIPYSEFLQDIREQKRERVIEKPKKEPWELNPQALSRDEYDHQTRYGRKRLRRPRPVWLSDTKKWTVGAPVNPIEWQILIQSDPARGRKRVSRVNAELSIGKICGQFRINEYTFSKCVSGLQDRRLLKYDGRFRCSKRVKKWLHPDMTGQRAGGEWHRRHIHGFIDEVNRLYGCYTYADRGLYPSVSMPDVIIIRPRLIEYVRNYEPRREPLKWDMRNPIYAEFKSAVDMRKYPNRLKKQLKRYDGVPLYLKVEARVYEVGDMLKECGRREATFSDLIGKAESDMVHLSGSERPRAESSFKPVLKKIKKAFRETYDRKARLKKTGTDQQGREHYSLILYDAMNTPKSLGQVIPRYAGDVEDFADLYFEKRYLGRITTADYIYTPSRKPTPENKTWRWDRSKTKGSKYRSFSV